MARARNLLPNLIFAGVYRAGTTSLFWYLALHPNVCASSIKETCYFLPLRYGRKLPPINKYSQYFRHCSNQKYIMEATPGYFYGGAVLARAIKERLGDVKIIIILRNPVDRLISFYRFKKSGIILNQSISLSEYVRLCESVPAEARRKAGE